LFLGLADRQYFIIAYESDPEAIARVVPEPLKPQGNVVLFEWYVIWARGATKQLAVGLFGCRASNFAISLVQD
jgi:hypothetical protein